MLYSGSWVWNSFLEPGFVPCPALSQADLFLRVPCLFQLARDLLRVWHSSSFTASPEGLLPLLLAFVLVDTPEFA